MSTMDVSWLRLPSTTELLDSEKFLGQGMFGLLQNKREPNDNGNETEAEVEASRVATLLVVEEGASLPPQEVKELRQTKAKSRSWLMIAMVIPNAILGVLIRLGIVYIETFPGQPVFPLAWAQFVGCLIMGALVSTRPMIDRCHWIGPFLYVGLSSGLCGSITTFSSWSLGIFSELANVSQSPHHPLQNILAGITELAVTIAMSLSGLNLGKHIGYALKRFLKTRGDNPNRSRMDNQDDTLVQEERPPMPPKSHWTLLEVAIGCVSLLLWVGLILAVIWVPISSSWRHVVFATIFAPVGAIVRWYLSRFNARYPTLPIGTFAVNVGGSWVLAAIVTLQYSGSHISDNPQLYCQILSGLQDGLCGCLTTISTFVLELVTLDRRASYRYALVSIILAQLGMIAIFGSFIWTRPDRHVGAKCFV